MGAGAKNGMMGGASMMPSSGAGNPIQQQFFGAQQSPSPAQQQIPPAPAPPMQPPEAKQPVPIQPMQQPTTPARPMNPGEGGPRGGGNSFMRNFFGMRGA